MGEDGNRTFRRERCQRCGVCAEKCYAKALELIGREMTIEEVIAEIIVDNLIRLDQLGAKTILRCPIIPGLNARNDHFAGIAAMANRLHNILEINLMPYHPLGRSKSERIGKPAAMEDATFPEAATVAVWEAAVAAATCVPVKKGS